jgi:hypothetical protein
MEVSVSVIFAFLVAAPAATPVAVEPLLPMEAALSKLCGNGDEKEASQELSARKKMTAAEWGAQ